MPVRGVERPLTIPSNPRARASVDPQRSPERPGKPTVAAYGRRRARAGAGPRMSEDSKGGERGRVLLQAMAWDRQTGLSPRRYARS